MFIGTWFVSLSESVSFYFVQPQDNQLVQELADFNTFTESNLDMEPEIYCDLEVQTKINNSTLW